MSARHFVLWVAKGRTHVASRSAYRRGEAGWRYDEARTVPAALVRELGWEEWQTPVNGPFPAFAADRLHQIASWLNDNGFSAEIVDAP